MGAATVQASDGHRDRAPAVEPDSELGPHAPASHTERQPATTGWLDAGLVERWYRWRDRLVTNSEFQRVMAGLWPTRWIVRGQANAMFDLCAGFVYAQVLRACVELDLFNVLAASPRSEAELAAILDMPIASVERLIGAARGLGLVERRPGARIGLSMRGGAFAGNPGIAAMVRHHAVLYEDLADPVALLRRGGRRDTGLSRYWAYADASDPSLLRGEAVASYCELMSQSQRMLSGDILDAVPLASARALLDVGGGDGTFARAALKRYPQLAVTIFDLPAVAERAQARLAADGLAHRAEAVGGNFFTDRLPVGADVITLIRVLFDHDDARVVTLLSACRQALAPGGRLVIAEPLSGITGLEAITDAYYGFYLLAMGRGRTRSLRDLSALLSAAGFARPRTVATRRPFLTSLITAGSADRPGRPA